MWVGGFTWKRKINCIKLWLCRQNLFIGFVFFTRFSDSKKNIKYHQIYPLKNTSGVCFQTCYVVKFSEIHFNVIPLHDHTAVGVGGSHRHVDVFFEGEDVRWHGLNGNGLMTHKVCEKQTKTDTASLLTKFKSRHLEPHLLNHIFHAVKSIWMTPYGVMAVIFWV